MSIGDVVKANQQLAITHVMSQIDDVVHDVSDNVVLSSKKQKLNTRPLNWREITDHYMQFGLVSTKDQYAVELAIYNMAAYRTNIKSKDG